MNVTTTRGAARSPAVSRPRCWPRPVVLATASGSGASTGCTVASSGSCSLRLVPACCSVPVTVSKPVSADAHLASVHFAFRSGLTGGNTDSNITVALNDGSVRIHPASGVNNGVLLESPGFGSIEFAHWYTANTFIQGTFEFAALAHTVTMAGGSATLLNLAERVHDHRPPSSTRSPGAAGRRSGTTASTTTATARSTTRTTSTAPVPATTPRARGAPRSRVSPRASTPVSRSSRGRCARSTS